jgi:N-dimethylarginine dimethylaminohydrolase
MVPEARAPQWGVDSETGVLRDVLLCRPDHYHWLPYNTVARETLSNGRDLDAAMLRAQFGEFEAALDEANVVRHYLSPDPLLPYQVYTRDSSLITPWGMAVLQLMRPRRRGETAPVVEFYDQAGVPRWQWSTAGSIEGGDIHMVAPGVLVVGCSGERTTREGAEQLCGWFGAAGWETRIESFPEHFLHFDLLFCMVARHLAVACIDVLEEGFLDWTRAHEIELIPVPYRTTMELGCNLLALGDGRVISPVGSRELNQRLRAHGIRVLDPDLSLFTSGGGGAHCMSLPLRRDAFDG